MCLVFDGCVRVEIGQWITLWFLSIGPRFSGYILHGVFESPFILRRSRCGLIRV